MNRDKSHAVDACSLAGLVLVGCLVVGCIDRVPRPGPEPSPPVPVVEPIVKGPISVLIVEETDDRAKQEMWPYLGVMSSVKIREYLNSHCRKIDGKPAWLWIDDDSDMSKANPYWQDAMNLPRSSLPWIAISNGTKGTSGPLPQTEDAVLALLKQWGGE